ncbi:MAG TPA: metallophosphoesterase [Candidatus Paceibacterota bacterium]
MHSKRAITLFLSVIVAILVLTNLAVFSALTHIFSIQSAAGRVGFGAVLGVLSFGFIAITIVDRRYYNAFTRFITHVLSVYMGLFAYLFFVSVMYGVLVFVHIPFARPVGGALLMASVIVTVYGLINARVVRVTSVTIPPGNTQWHSRKAIFVSDLHLGQVLGAQFARTVVAAINSRTPDIVFIGGDLFDGTTAPDLDVLLAPLRNLRPAHGIYFITGNHEEFGDGSPFLEAIARAGITILQDKLIEIDGLQIIGVDDTTSEKQENFERILAGMHIDRNKPSILLRHQPKHLSVAEAAGITLQMSGHTHLGQQWPFGYIAQWAFKGYAYGLKMLGAMTVYTSSGVGTWGPPVRVGTRSEIVEVTFGVQ